MAGRGPLPNPERRRRNEATIPTTNLPASGRKGAAPKVPAAYVLQGAGKAWWKWAWSTPQAAAWDQGAIYLAARRASLEDDLATLELVDNFDLAELIGAGSDEDESVRILGALIGKLKALAGGRIAVLREMREIEGKLGLSPKALAELRWTIVADDDAEKAEPKPKATRATKDRRARLTVVAS